MYQTDYSNNEYYDSANKSYFKNQLGEHYAKLASGTQIYLEINSFDVMAKKYVNGVLQPYFAFHKDGYPICPRLKYNMKSLEVDIPYPTSSVTNKQLYPVLNDTDEIYISLNGHCKYAKNDKADEYFAKKKNKEYYAFKLNPLGHSLEFVAKNNQNENIYILKNNNYVYPFNLTTKRPIFPLDLQGNETYLKFKGREQYCINSSNWPIYAKSKHGDELLAFDHSKNKFYYAFALIGGKKVELYPQLKNKSQFYLEHENKKIYAYHPVYREFYAKDFNHCEFFADKDHVPYYAISFQNSQIYPKSNLNEEIYLKINGVEIAAKNLNTQKYFYAKRANQDEFYPKRIIKTHDPEKTQEAN